MSFQRLSVFCVPFAASLIAFSPVGAASAAPGYDPQGSDSSATPAGDLDQAAPEAPAGDATDIAPAALADCGTARWCVWDLSGFTGGRFDKTTNVDNFVWFTFIGTAKSIDNQTESVRNRMSSTMAFYDRGGYQSQLFCVRSTSNQGYLTTATANRVSSARTISSPNGCF
ncbi:MAG: peptidase inhibitor family I36 protein [Mobilicoccus sp.]|nr:peptidase inhibitor family I36 protein [Mobilicoccus sp.]